MCRHPMDQRWQHSRIIWMCCKCCQYFWGDKNTNKPQGIYAWQNKEEP